MKVFKKILVLIAVVLVSFLVSCKKPKTTLKEVTFSNMITSMTKGDVFVVDYSTQEGVSSTFASSNTNVATVDNNTVTAVGVGSFTLTATFKLGEESKKYEFTIEVKGKEYSIDYELDGGALANGAITSYQEGIAVTLPVPEKDGYTFLGWTLTSGSTEYITEISSSQTGDVTVYANWSKDTVYGNITYNLNGGKNPSNAPTKYEVGKVLTLPTPEKSGYEFLGWTLSSSSTSYITKLPATQTGNVTLYAKWKAVVVKSNINYELDGGTNPTSAPSEYEEGKGVTLPTPEKSGYTFLGWSLEEGSTSYVKSISSSQKGDVTVYANWEVYVEPNPGETFNIKYELNGGSWSWTAGTVSAPAKGIDSVSNLPEIFMGDFYAYLLENNLLNSSKVNQKLQVSNWIQFSSPYGDPVAWYNATSTGGYSAADGYSELFFDSVNNYEAVGGFLGTSPYKEKYANLTKHMIQLTVARYSMETTHKSFKGACGFVLDGYFYGTQGLKGGTFDALRGTIPTPTVGYVGSTSSKNTYEVLSAAAGTTVKLVAPVKEGYMFLGWYTNPECTGDKVTSVSKECTLYAGWKELSPVYKINYVLNGGENPEDAPLEFAFGVGAELPKPTKEGYTFIGWTTDAEGQNLISKISTEEDADVTVYANWKEGEEKLYTITYNYTDGELPSHKATSFEEFEQGFWAAFSDWYGNTEDLATFKTKVLAAWSGKSAGGYNFYLVAGNGQENSEYFINDPETPEVWRNWFKEFESIIVSINAEQSAWGSAYVGYARLYELLSNSTVSYWTTERKTTMWNATYIYEELVTEYELGQEFELINLVIDDGRTFLGWYDANGNKVEKIHPNTEGNLVLTAKWSEAIPVETFEITNKIEKLGKLSQHQLTWVIGPTNATFKEVSFTSSNPNVLTVTNKGLIEAVDTGTAKISVVVYGNKTLNMEFEVEVYVAPYIDGEFIDTSYVVANQVIELDATLIGNITDTLVWTSKTPEIATVDQNGFVTGVKEGLAEIVVTCANNKDISFTFYVTVFDEEPTGLLKLLVDSNNKEIFTKEDLLIGIKIGSDGAYYSDIVGSVSKLLFEEYKVYDTYYLSSSSADLDNISTLNGDGIGGIDFITVHYAADMPYNSSAMYHGGRNLASYNRDCNVNHKAGKSGYAASWHYSVGNDGIWSCQTESYGAWHAGRSNKMTWTISNVTTSQVGTDVYPTDVTLGSDGYFYIKGVKTSIKNSTSGTKLNGMGLGVKLVGDTWYLGGHQYKSDYGYIGSTGGNNNSIGMETSVREGSDLWLTWQYTAQLCAKLLLKYQLPLNRLVGHHFFSGKWCPQPMLENDLEIWYEFVELTRQEMDLYQNYSDSKLSFSSSSSYLKDNGRVSELPYNPECVTYTVTYTENGVTKTVTLSSILPGALE